MAQTDPKLISEGDLKDRLGAQDVLFQSQFDTQHHLIQSSLEAFTRKLSNVNEQLGDKLGELSDETSKVKQDLVVLKEDIDEVKENIRTLKTPA